MKGRELKKVFRELIADIREHRHSWLDSFVLCVIVLSAILIGMETDQELMASWGWLFHIFDLIVLWIFVVELVIKVIAHGSKPWRYFNSAWNVFDFVIVLVGFAPIVIHYLHPDTSTDLHAVATLRLIRLARAIRVMRVFRIVTHLRELQILVETLMGSFKRLVYVGLLLVCLFYVYAVVGVFLFRDNDSANFGTLHEAHMTLFKCITGDGWSEVMETEIHPAQQSASTTEVESFPVLAPLYFGSFIVIGSYVLLNLVVGIIISAMEQANDAHDAALTKEIHESEKLQAEVLDDILLRLQGIEESIRKKT